MFLRIKSAYLDSPVSSSYSSLLTCIEVPREGVADILPMAEENVCSYLKRTGLTKCHGPNFF